MQSLTVILLLLAWLSFILQISITKQKTTLIIFLSAIAVGLYLSYPYAIEQSYDKFKSITGNKTIMSNLMVFQIIESITGMLFSIFLIRMFYNEKVHKIFRWFSYFPGIVIIPAVFYTESFLFLNVAGLNFQVFAIIIAIAMPLILIGLRILTKKLVPEYDLRLELKFILHTVQLFVAIILSIQLFSLPTAGNYIQDFPIYQLLALLMLMLVFGVIGMMNYNRRMKKLMC